MSARCSVTFLNGVHFVSVCARVSARRESTTRTHRRNTQTTQTYVCVCFKQHGGVNESACLWPSLFGALRTAKWLPHAAPRRLAVFNQ